MVRQSFQLLERSEKYLKSQMMCFKDLKRTLTSSAEKARKLQSSAFCRSPSVNSTNSTTSDSSTPSSSRSSHSSRSQHHQQRPVPAPEVSEKEQVSKRQTETIDGVLLKRDSSGRNWFHGPGGIRKQQIGWKIPTNRIDPEINLKTSHGRRSQLAMRNDMRSVSRQDDTAFNQNHPVNDPSSRLTRSRLRRVSTIGSVADVHKIETMSIESIESVEAAIGKAVSVSDSESDYEATNQRHVRRKSKATSNWIVFTSTKS